MLRSKILILAITIMSVIASVNAEPQDSTTHILFLNSYDHRMNWPERILKGIEETLKPEMNNINLHYEALDSKEFHTQEYYDEFRHYLEFKYRDYNFSLIFCSDNNAYDFLLDNHKEMYPDVPIVFCGVNNFDSSILQLHPEITGIAEIQSTKNTVELALRLHPETKELYIINDYLKTGRAWFEQMESELKYFENKIKLTYSENLSMVEMQYKVSSLDRNTLVLLGVFFADKNGKFSTYERMAELIAEKSGVPVYSLAGFNIQPGVIGGQVISGFTHGEAIANIGLRILSGESPHDIPIGWGEYNRFIFNYPQLDRFSISLKDLPEDSIILNRPFSLYTQYKSQIWLIIAAFCALSFTLIALILNITRKKKTEKEYSDLQTLWERMFEDSVEAIFIYNTDLIVEQVNKSFSRITGYLREETIGNPISDFESEYFTDELKAEMSRMIKAKGMWTGELLNRRKSGEVFSMHLSISVFNDALNDETKIIGVFHDISDKKQHEEELKWMSQYDTLTGFSNRTFFLDILSSELKASERSGEICAVMLLNLDGLKNINNTYGFLAGDQIIQEFSKRLKSGLREEDIVSRFGGDEFAVLAPRFKDRHQVNVVIKRIREKVLNPIIIDGNSIDLSVSIGISLFPSDGTAEKELIAKSGTALKRTKTDRKGSYSLYNSEQDKAVMANSELEMHLKKALILDEMDVFFQPKVNPVENRIIGFEALIRWNKNHDKWIPPDIFIPISEDNGFIIELGYFVINKACDFINSLKENNYTGFHVGVNISAKQFADPDFIDNLINIVESKKVAPSEIDLEITESITASEVYNAIDSLTRLSKYGFNISIDDFGTGYSSLQYLMTLPFDTIKIDKSFVDSILDGNGKETILDTMISLSHSLKKNIVAEGVETEEQVRYLIDKKCQLIQGYYYSKPLPMTDILELMKSDKFK